jgi:hypothetical protein
LQATLLYFDGLLSIKMIQKLNFKTLLMNTKIKFLPTILIIFLCQSQTFAQKPNFTGTWMLNLEKSKFEFGPEGLTSSIFIINQDGDNFRLTRTHIYGEKKNKLSFKMMADGKMRRVKILFKGKLEWRENNLQATLWRKKFLNIVNYKFGNNQNEFIADEVFTGYPKNHHTIWVFDRENSK